MLSSSPSLLRRISTCNIKPSLSLPRAPPCHLPPWDLCTLSMHYIQNGLLFSSHDHASSSLPPAADAVTHLKTALSLVLSHFRPLAGRFVSETVYDATGEPFGMHVYLDSDDSGAEFTHAIAADVSVADLLSPDVPSFLHSFFPLNGAVNYDGISLPLLAVQFTELTDGFFVACSFNHTVGDGSAYWSFLNAWAEIARSGAGDGSISRSPVHDRWFIGGHKNAPIRLPFTHPDQFIERFPLPTARCVEHVFHFTPESIALLKAKVNRECGSGDATISSFQSVASLVWRSVTRARGLPADQATSCGSAIDCRSRLRPPIPAEYFGGAVDVVVATATAGELLARGIGWGARLVHEAVEAHTDDVVRQAVASRVEAPMLFRLSEHDSCGVKLGSSARFDVYGCDFGWGRPAAVRSGGANKYDGKMTFHPGKEGMDLEVCLEPETMKALMRDEEFMNIVL